MTDLTKEMQPAKANIIRIIFSRPQALFESSLSANLEITMLGTITLVTFLLLGLNSIQDSHAASTFKIWAIAFNVSPEAGHISACSFATTVQAVKCEYFDLSKLSLKKGNSPNFVIGFVPVVLDSPPPADMQMCLEAQQEPGTNAKPGNWLFQCKPVTKDSKGFYVANFNLKGMKPTIPGPTNDLTFNQTGKNGFRDSRQIILNHYSLVSRFGSSGVGHGQFNHPMSVGMDPNGQRLYVADTENNRIEVLHRDGDFISAWGSLGRGNGQFNGPGSVAVDEDNKTVFVADIKNNRIEKFDIQGRYLGQWGTLGNGEGQFDHPGDIALNIDKKILYVTDVYNNRVQVFYYNGQFVNQWGSFGNGEGQFNRPAGITFNPENNLIYVSDTVNNRIQVFDDKGNFVKKWGSFGFGDGQFARPDGVFSEPSEKKVYVADRQNHRIQVFDDVGAFITKWNVSNKQGGLVKPRDVAIDSSGQIYVVDKEGSEIDVFLHGTGPSTQKNQDKKTTTTTTNTKTTIKKEAVLTNPTSSNTLSIHFNDFDHANYKGKTTVTIENSAVHEVLGK